MNTESNSLRDRHFNKRYHVDISLLVGSTANYAGDGPTVRSDSMLLNGLKIQKISMRYFVADINVYVLRAIFPNNNVKLGDEVISLNDIYCEHIRNVTKFIETTQISKICLKSALTQILYTEEKVQVNPVSLTQSTFEVPEVRKRLRTNGT